MSFWGELRRRNVVKVAVAYAIVGWLLLQVVDTLLPAFGAPDWVLPVFVLLLTTGFVVALILTWAYELTPEGMKPTKSVPLSESVTHVTGRKLDFAIIAFLMLAVGFLVIDKYLFVDSDVEAVVRETTTPTVASTAERPSPAVAEEERDVLPNSVAVLPFENLSPNEEDAYFAAGIHEEVLNQLAKPRNVSVISRTSMMRYSGSGLSVPEIAHELNVETVMEGSVRYAGDRVRITAQLIDAETDQHLWSESYERDLADIFAIQADIAMNIANSLEAEFSPLEQASVEQVPTFSVDAYGFFLRALNAGTGQEVLDLLDQALEIDPSFALAHGVKAFVLSQALTNTVVATATDSAQRSNLETQIRQHAERALTLDANVGVAHAALGSMEFINWHWTDARRAFERAVDSMASSTQGILPYIWLDSFTDRHQEAISLAQRLIQLNPNAPGLLGILGIARAYANDYDLAAQGLRIAAESTGSFLYREWLAHVEIVRGNEAVALKELEVIAEARGGGATAFDSSVSASYASARLGRSEPAARMLEALQARATDGTAVGAGDWAMVYLAVGDEDQALEWLEITAEKARNHQPDEAFYNLMMLTMNVVNDPVLDQPEFVDVRNRIRGD